MSYSILQFVNFIIALVRHIMCDFFKTQIFIMENAKESVLQRFSILFLICRDERVTFQSQRYKECG